MGRLLHFHAWCGSDSRGLGPRAPRVRGTHHPKTNSDHWCTLVWLMITALRRYERWYKYQKTAPWLDDNPQGFEISKGHMFDHTAAFAVLWGANDNARLDNFE